MKSLFRVALILPLFAIAACQTMPYQPYAREIKKKPGVGGEIALKEEHRDEDRAKAQTLMETNCGTAPVKVIEEGEVVVGQTTNTGSRKTHTAAQDGTQVGSLFGMPITSGGNAPSDNTNSVATTTAIKEWKIDYECTKPVEEAAATPAKKGKKHKSQN